MRRRQGGGTAYPVSACERGMCTHLRACPQKQPAFRETAQGSMSLLSDPVPRPVTTSTAGPFFGQDGGQMAAAGTSARL